MANPATCKHYVIQAFLVFTDDFKAKLVCLSCGTDVSDPETRRGKNYEYDIDRNVWVRTPRGGR